MPEQVHKEPAKTASKDTKDAKNKPKKKPEPPKMKEVTKVVSYYKQKRVQLQNDVTQFDNIYQADVLNLKDLNLILFSKDGG